MAFCGFEGKYLSLIIYLCKLSRKKSHAALPPCPSYRPKKEQFGQGLFLFSLYPCGFGILYIILTLSSL